MVTIFQQKYTGTKLAITCDNIATANVAMYSLNTQMSEKNSLKDDCWSFFKVNRFFCNVVIYIP